VTAERQRGRKTEAGYDKACEQRDGRMHCNAAPRTAGVTICSAGWFQRQQP